MGIMKLISIAAFVMYINPSQSLSTINYSRKCIFSEISRTNAIVFRFKTSDTSATYSFFVNETPHKSTLVLVDSRQGSIRLARSLQGILTWSRADSTVRITGVLTQTTNSLITKIAIEFIILKEGYADSMLTSILSTVPTMAKPSNPFRPTSSKYPIYKKLHSLLMRGTKRSTGTSLAECKFRAAYNKLMELIFDQLKASTLTTNLDFHVGPQGILSPEKLEELIEATGCIPELQLSQCPQEAFRYRTIDGTCNNLRERTNGAAETGFFRFLPAEYFDAEGLDEPAGGGLNQINAPNYPNPLIVTEDYIIIQSQNQPNRDNIAHMFMQWGQFLDHDLTLAPESENGDVCEEIPCNNSPADFTNPCFAIQPVRQRPCIRLIRSAARCPINGFKLLPREQINVNTAYIDGSMIYGSSESVAKSVRDFNNGNDRGLLRTSAGGNLLPIENSILGEPNNLCLNLGGCFLAGDIRVNEQAALAAMHTLWVREHNRIARQLRRLNQHWDGERIYQETRKIIGALVQQITYEEWLPIAIGRDALRPFRRYNPRVNAGISNAFATAAFRMGHSLVNPKFTYLKNNFAPFPFSPIPLRNAFFNNTITQLEGADGWIVGMVGNTSQEMDNEMAIGLTDELFERENINREGLSLSALNMQRGREHGLPAYSAFLAECGRRFKDLYPIDVSNVKTFDQIRPLFPPAVFESIRSVYNNDPTSTDLFSAGMGELPTDKRFGRPRRRSPDDCFLPEPILGPTFTCLFIDQFERLRDGDRFFYLNPGQFTRDQLTAIQDRKFSDIICNNINIVSVPKAVFLTDRKYSCANRPNRIDLEPWIERVTSCSQRPCRNGGICRQFQGRTSSFVRCRCPREFRGRFCQNRV